MKTTTGILSIALASGLLAACGGSDSNSTREQAMADSAAAHGIDADVTLNDDGETEKVVINAGGGQVGKNLDLPAGFPEDISLPAGWDIMSSSSPLPGSFNLQALSPDSAADILDTLRTRLTADGWTETASDSPTPAMSRINFEKDDRMANFNIIENGETRAVQILTMPKP